MIDGVPSSSDACKIYLFNLHNMINHVKLVCLCSVGVIV